MSRLFWTLTVSLLPVLNIACGAGGGNPSDYEYVSNPTFTFNVSPPVGWTFFPPTPSEAQNVVWFFVGQSNNSAQALQKGNGQMTAAMISSLSQANKPLQGVTITPEFVPVSVQNPGVLTTGVGPLYGKVEGGALSQTAPGAATFIWTPFSQVVTIKMTGIGATRYDWMLVQNTFMQQLMLNFDARFVNEIILTGTVAG